MNANIKMDNIQDMNKISKFGYKSTLRRILVTVPHLAIGLTHHVFLETLVLLVILSCLFSTNKSGHCKTRLGCYMKTTTVIMILVFVLIRIKTAIR